METAKITGNKLYEYNGTGNSALWTGLEVNNCKDITLTDNQITEIIQQGVNGNGYGVKFWSLSDWKLTATLNTFTGNAGGIWVIVGETSTNPRSFKFPSGLI
jgi:hypothetical protein